jgi:hypothetical protein
MEMGQRHGDFNWRRGAQRRSRGERSRSAPKREPLYLSWLPYCSTPAVAPRFYPASSLRNSSWFIGRENIG